MIAIGADHAGYLLKQYLIERLTSDGHEVRDCGTDSTDPVDYPFICERVGREVVASDAEFGIVIGGTGGGEMIAANKVNGVRAVSCADVFSAKMSREHDDANVIALGARITAAEHAYEIVRVWLETPFLGGRYARRVAQIGEIEEHAVARS